MQHKESSTQTNIPSKDAIAEAQKQAEQDIKTDPDVNLEPKPGDDLDEGELARQEGEE